MAVSGFFLGGLGTKSHSDVGVVGRHKEYYMGEGGGFPWIQAMVSLVSPKLFVAYRDTKGVPKIILTCCTNELVWCKFEKVTKACHSS
jgi:hypothetical protein